MPGILETLEKGYDRQEQYSSRNCVFIHILKGKIKIIIIIIII